jgi:hypothetical protein
MDSSTVGYRIQASACIISHAALTQTQNPIHMFSPVSKLSWNSKLCLQCADYVNHGYCKVLATASLYTLFGFCTKLMALWLTFSSFEFLEASLWGTAELVVFAETTTPRIPRVWQDDNLVHHPAEQRWSWNWKAWTKEEVTFLSVVKGSEIHCQALRLRERLQGQEHPGTLTSMNNLANVLRES